MGENIGGNKISFVLSGTDVSVANCLRKAMISEVFSTPSASFRLLFPY